jgi:hypothetical protein
MIRSWPSNAFGICENVQESPKKCSAAITGKPMRGFVWVDASHARGKALHDWIALAEKL